MNTVMLPKRVTPCSKPPPELLVRVVRVDLAQDVFVAVRVRDCLPVDA
uniref:Uncharacterized protein n=1 Tax=Anopheles atroparvus TaxID=41427 RepID=A0AAG5DH79_ANOAO